MNSIVQLNQHLDWIRFGFGLEWDRLHIKVNILTLGSDYFYIYLYKLYLDISNINNSLNSMHMIMINGLTNLFVSWKYKLNIYCIQCANYVRLSKFHASTNVRMTS